MQLDYATLDATVSSRGDWRLQIFYCFYYPPPLLSIKYRAAREAYE